MEILLGVLLIGIVLVLIWFSSSPPPYRNQGEDTWNKWIEEDKNKKLIEVNDEKYKRWKEVTETKFEKKTVPDDYYQSEEYKKFCEERTKKYNELIAKGEIEAFSPEEQVFYGDRGGRYRIRYNKNGEPYRDYF